MEQEFVDITPQGVHDGKGQKGRSTTVFQESELNHIRTNKGGLTKEGVLKKIEIWTQSSNKHSVIMYKTMLRNCDKLEKSGTVKVKTSRGKEETLTVFSRDKKTGEAKWTGTLKG